MRVDAVAAPLAPPTAGAAATAAATGELPAPWRSARGSRHAEPLGLTQVRVHPESRHFQNSTAEREGGKREAEAEEHRQRLLAFLSRFHSKPPGGSGTAQQPGQPDGAAAGEDRALAVAGPCTLGLAMERKRYLVVLPAGDKFDTNRRARACAASCHCRPERAGEPTTTTSTW